LTILVKENRMILLQTVAE